MHTFEFDGEKYKKAYKHQKILTQPAMPAIYFLAYEHLYGVLVTSNFWTVPYVVVVNYQLKTDINNPMIGLQPLVQSR